ncbi:MAG: hypothetical protein JKY60_13040 [Kordiimonadaceae bacterium]|nr:hypothetical protein [Kordiimonadaceae bacterium]
MANLTKFQVQLSKDVEKCLMILRVEYTTTTETAEDDRIGTYNLFYVLDQTIEIYVYADFTGLFDDRPNSERAYHFENHRGTTEEQIHLDTIAALKHVLATPGSTEMGNDYFDAPSPWIRASSFKWPFKWPWK